LFDVDVCITVSVM